MLMNTEHTSNPDKQTDKTSFAKLSEIFNLSQDQAHPDKIDNEIRNNVKAAGTNLWILMLAILIASIGLNMNSTAVIIGAMLISPLMGPIVGIGYGTAVFDVKLIKVSLRNISIFIIISLLTASLYFSITPLTTAQSELLARTQPTLWDVLIAFFGGAAGMIAMTRKEGSNVIPGVAIATALMPPLCTAGYGLSQGNWQYFVGAFYLFTINCVFIAIASLVITRLLKMPRRGLISESNIKIQKYILITVTLLVMLPSGYLAVQMVQQEIFNNRVNQVIKSIEQEEDLWILKKEMNHKNNTLRLMMSGTGDSQYISQKISERLVLSGIHNPIVNIAYAGGSRDNIRSLYRELADSQNTPTAQLQEQLQQQARHIATLEQKIQNTPNHAQLLKELQVQFPDAQNLFIGTGEVSQKIDNMNWQSTPQILVWLELSQPIAELEKQKLHDWLKIRLDADIQLVINNTK